VSIIFYRLGLEQMATFSIMGECSISNGTGGSGGVPISGHKPRIGADLEKRGPLHDINLNEA